MNKLILALAVTLAAAPQVALAQHYTHAVAKPAHKQVKPAFDATAFFAERALNGN